MLCSNEISTFYNFYNLLWYIFRSRCSEEENLIFFSFVRTQNLRSRRAYIYLKFHNIYKKTRGFNLIFKSNLLWKNWMLEYLLKCCENVMWMRPICKGFWGASSYTELEKDRQHTEHSTVHSRQCEEMSKTLNQILKSLWKEKVLLLQWVRPESCFSSAHLQTT